MPKKKLEKWPLLDQNHGLISLKKNVNFSTFWIFCFYNLERRFFDLEYRKRHFPRLYCLKRKVEKMAIFERKPWVNPLKNVNFSTFRTFYFYRLENRFLVLEYRKRHFPGLYWLKRKVGKIVISGAKPWVNPFGIISILQLFKVPVFIA